ITIGLILLLLGDLLAVIMGLGDTSGGVVIDTLGGTYTTSAWWVFVAGWASGALLLLGLAFLRRGLRRALARRQELRRLHQLERQTAHQLGGAGGSPATPADPLLPQEPQPPLDPLGETRPSPKP
ncbi:MAG: hypothetical protein ACRC0L_10955, partial [Angustibacter sp.]